jgi:hypothetical protein
VGLLVFGFVSLIYILFVAARPYPTATEKQLLGWANG